MIRGVVVPAGERRQIDVPVARLPPTNTSLSIQVEALHGREPGPRLWLSAAIHGDELNGIEIVRRVLARVDPRSLRGAILAVPTANVFGVVNQSRYLPDRRDLNRSFPGSARGALAARLAKIFMTEVVERTAYGIDFHTGSNHRTNLPQIRCDTDDPETRRCAVAFGSPLVVHSRTRDGSLRQAATDLGRHVLLFEGGEPLRFEEDVITSGVDGTLRVLEALEMIDVASPTSAAIAPIATRTHWVRARRGGLARLTIDCGQSVRRREVLGSIGDAFGASAVKIVTPSDGIVIGLAKNPLVNQGDGLVHLATEFES